MSNITMVIFGLIASMAAFTDLPERMQRVFGESILLGQQIATAGDLRSMSEMLDVHYIKRGRYPEEEDFIEWIADTFKGSNLKKLGEDHWGNDYLYVVSNKGKAYLLRSIGADSIVGNDDDMTVRGP